MCPARSGNLLAPTSVPRKARLRFSILAATVSIETFMPLVYDLGA